MALECIVNSFWGGGAATFTSSTLQIFIEGLLCAREIVTTAVVRGQLQLVQQLQRSYSANDIDMADGETRVSQFVQF